MSEYWKSTPKYWCKQCSVYVRDTKLEKANHEATGKHQGNLRKFLRDIYKENEKEERDKQRAKEEIARLNGTKADQKQPSSQLPRGSVSKVPLRVATVEERRAQMMQLAAMGVVVPEQYRQDLALAGEWQTVTEEATAQTREKELKDSTTRMSGSVSSITSTSSKKRRAHELDLTDERTGRKIVWGSATKELQVSTGDDNELDSLLDGSKLSSKTESLMETRIYQTEIEADTEDSIIHVKPEERDSQTPTVPYQDTDKWDAANDDQIVFKKRRKKDNPM